MAVSDQLLVEETNEGSVIENGQLGHRDFEVLDLQIAGGDNRLTTSRIFLKERRQVQVFLLLLLTWSDGLGGGLDDGLPEAALCLLKKMIGGGDVCGANPT